MSELLEVSSVRSDLTTCGKCGETDCEGDCEKEPLYKVNHAAWEAHCPKRGEEIELFRVVYKKRYEHEEVGKARCDKKLEGEQRRPGSMRNVSFVRFCFWQC